MSRRKLPARARRQAGRVADQGASEQPSQDAHGDPASASDHGVARRQRPLHVRKRRQPGRKTSAPPDPDDAHHNDEQNRPTDADPGSGEEGGEPSKGDVLDETAGGDSGGHDPTRAIGKGNPPRGSQTKKGQVLNPYGRKGKPGRKTSSGDVEARPSSELDKVLNQKIQITKDGKEITVSGSQAYSEKIFHEAINGDDKARGRLQALMRHDAMIKKAASREPESGAEQPAPALSPSEADAVIRDFLAIGGATLFGPETDDDPDGIQGSSDGGRGDGCGDKRI